MQIRDRGFSSRTGCLYVGRRVLVRFPIKGMVQKLVDTFWNVREYSPNRTAKSRPKCLIFGLFAPLCADYGLNCTHIDFCLFEKCKPNSAGK